MWTVTYRPFDKAPWTPTEIKAESTEATWLAWDAWRKANAVIDYYAVQVEPAKDASK